MDPNEYTLAWQAYIASAAFAVLILWTLTRGPGWLYFKWLLRLLLIALVATPIFHADAPGQFVPAVVPATLGWMLGGQVEAMPAWRLLGLGAVVAVLLTVPMAKLERRVRSWFAPKTRAEPLSDTAHGADPASD